VGPGAGASEQWTLGRTRALLDLAGSPDRALCCILVAGTKGKGSTAAFLASIVGAAGIRAGLYTQPHLQDYRERIRIDGAALRPAELALAIDEVRPVVARFRRLYPAAGAPTTFEITTVIALQRFAAAGCTVAILEVGLGGRLDATNAVDPTISVITPISRDHTAILGRTLGAIAREKAGILRAGHLAFIAPQRPVVSRALASACRASGARCVIVPPLPARTGRLSLAGDHQRVNAALAAAVARALPGQVPSQAAIARGLRRVRWPGRLERVGGRRPVVLDGAHNGASAQLLARELGRLAGRQPIHLVIGVYRDKDVREIVRPLVPLARLVVVTSPASPRALGAADLAALCRQEGARDVRIVPSTAAALAVARRAAGGPTPLVAVTGSLRLVGEARDALGLRLVEALWPRGRR